MIKYHAWICIEEVEIVRETTYQVILKTFGGGERRAAKQSEDSGYFDTWQEAKDFMLKKEEDKLAGIQRQFEYVTAKRDKILQWQDPAITKQ